MFGFGFAHHPACCVALYQAAKMIFLFQRFLTVHVLYDVVSDSFIAYLGQFVQLFAKILIKSAVIFGIA
jgi:hypothetical protein